LTSNKLDTWTCFPSRITKAVCGNILLMDFMILVLDQSWYAVKRAWKAMTKIKVMARARLATAGGSPSGSDEKKKRKKETLNC